MPPRGVGPTGAGCPGHGGGEEPLADVRIQAVDGDVEGREALGQDAPDLPFLQVRERDEVPVQKGEAIVLVPHVDALSHARGALVHEAEDAVVPAEAHLRVLEVRAELRVQEPPLVRDGEGAPPLPLDVEHDRVVRHVEVEVQLVPEPLAVDREDLVPFDQAQRLGRAVARNVRDPHDSSGCQRMERATGFEPATLSLGS